MIPKQARDQLGFAAGTELELTVSGRHLGLSMAPVGVQVVEEDGVGVLVPDRPQPPLTVAQVRELLEHGRR